MRFFRHCRLKLNRFFKNLPNNIWETTKEILFIALLEPFVRLWYFFTDDY